MPSLDDETIPDLVKICVASDSGDGKTGSLAPLADAGFNIRVLDFDGSRLTALRGHMKKPENRKNVAYVDQLQDDLKLIAGRIGITKAPAFQRAMDALDKGGTEYWGVDIPPIKEWTPRDILVIDTLSSCGRTSLQMVLSANNAGMKQPEIQHYGTAMENIERLLMMITGKTTNCHVIVNTHITTVEGMVKPQPEALGSKLPPKVGRYFDNLIGMGIKEGKRGFKTDKNGLMTFKSAVPLEPFIPIETGWLTIFEKLTGKKIAEILA